MTPPLESQHSDHVGEVESGFLRPGYSARCSCGWEGHTVFATSADAERAIQNHQRHAHLEAEKETR